ncbi:DNA methyltransferase [Mycobacterium phage Anthony]|uniref:Cytosine-specific methyltransferase n=1 Tax=Mycobacterium phage Anthony TaxID=2599857 RepID=A0A5J6TI47_9CAUD|nr:DNA methyltransferase [Mycobacterium phage Anthony]QFG10450.1 DNA methylase [Mycobacterium phage Anthony]
MLRIGSLFSGAGGLDLAVEQVFEAITVWQCESERAPSLVLAKRFGVPNLGDITKVNWHDVPPIDILCGGFPCQDLSSAGRKAGIAAGTRSGLWSYFAEAIDILRPRAVVIENVRGILSGKAVRTSDVEPDSTVVGTGLRAAGAVLGDLADLGYDAQWTTIGASDVGAPHQRKRVIFLAYPSDAGSAGR